jgi:hypothetical protein
LIMLPWDVMAARMRSGSVGRGIGVRRQRGRWPQLDPNGETVPKAGSTSTQFGTRRTNAKIHEIARPVGPSAALMTRTYRSLVPGSTSIDLPVLIEPQPKNEPLGIWHDST